MNNSVYIISVSMIVTITDWLIHAQFDPDFYECFDVLAQLENEKKNQFYNKSNNSWYTAEIE